MPKNNTRLTRINDEIMRAASDVIRFEMSDPRIGTVVSVVGAKTTQDLKFCKILVSILEVDKGVQEGNIRDEQERDEIKETMEALSNARGFVRKRIAEILNLRHTPEITFVLDDSIAHAMRMHRLIDEVTKNDS